MVFESFNGFGNFKQGPNRLNALPPAATTDTEIRCSSPTAATQADAISTIAAATTTNVHTVPPPPNDPLANLIAGPSHLPVLVVDKALPPIPRSGSVSFDLPPTTPKSRPSLTRSVSTLACTSSEIGTSCVIPTAGLSLPRSSKSNLTAQLRPPSSFLPGNRASTGLHEFPTAEDGPHVLTPRFPDDINRRSRGLSLGALSFLSLAAVDFRAKAKEPSHDKLPTSPQSCPKPLSRKPSLWGKNKSSQPGDRSPLQNPANTTSPSSSLLPPQLPPLPNMSLSSAFTGIDDFSKGIAARFGLRRHSAESLSSQFARRQSSNATQHKKRGSQISTPTSSSSSFSEQMPPLTSASQSFTFPQTVDESNGSIVPPAKRRRAQTNPSHSLSPGSLPYLDIPKSSSFASQSKSSISSSFNSLPLGEVTIPTPDADTETPNVYLERVRTVVNKSELASVLASSAEPMYVGALRAYLRDFDFRDEPLDIALRKFLMEVGLPRETQQIDRVIEAFSLRYSECNPDLFSNEDHAYILAFSLIMLHTDAFNKSNRTKMTKGDYVKNATLPGEFPEVLGCFYDNIIFSPFIFIEDPLDINGTVGPSPDTATRRQRRPPTPTTAVGLLTKSRVDPYYLIANNLLESMRTEVEKVFPLNNPFNFQGVACPSDGWELRKALCNAWLIQVEAPSNPRPLFSKSASADVISVPPTTPNIIVGLPAAKPMTLKVMKVGILHRKDDITGRGKRASMRKWKTWSVVLTGSQLLFFRDMTIASQLMGRFGSDHDSSASETVFKPDDIISVKDAVALYDESYTKHNNTFRFIPSDGRQILLQTNDTRDMNGWLSSINYASAFKSVGMRIRPSYMSQRDIHLTGVAAATSHLHDIQLHTTPASSPSQWDSNAPRELMGMLSANSFDERPFLKHRLTIPPGGVDLDNISIVESAKTELFETTFKRVKADLAKIDIPIEGKHLGPVISPIALASSSNPLSTRLLSRHDIIQQKLQELELQLAAVRVQLEEGMRFLRNIAILRPLQSATRAKLLHIIQNFVATKKLLVLRVDSLRLAHHITVLRDDLEAEVHSLDMMKNIALDAAKQTLEERQPGMILQVTVSSHHSDDEPRGPDTPHRHSRTLSNTSLTESFHSALEYGSDWPTDPASISRTPSQTFESPRPSTSSSPLNMVPDPNNSRIERSSSFSSSTGESHKEPNKYPLLLNEVEVEEAEPWNRTRAAKRVSLIRVPSSVAFSKWTGHQTSYTPLDS